MGRRAIVLDSGALTEKATIIIPSIVIAESTTGTARDAGVNQVLSTLRETASLTESLARSAASLRFRAGRPLRDTIDAVVVATADVTAGTIILTADAKDLSPLAAVCGRSKVLAAR